ncbi:MAG: hypothetical protein V1820_04800 [archaeon]
MEETGNNPEEALKDAFIVLSKARQSAMEELSLAQRVREALEQKVSEAKARAESATRAKEYLERSFSDLEAKIGERKDDFSRLSTLSESLASNLQKVVAYLERLHSEVDGARNDYSRKRGEVEDLKKEVEGLSARIAVVQDAIGTSSGEFGEKVAFFQAESAKISEALRNFQAKMESARLASSEIEKAAQTVESIASQRKAEISEIVNSFNSESRSMRELAEKVFSQVDQAKHSLSENSVETAKIKDFVDRTAPEIQDRLSKVELLREQIEAKRSALSEMVSSGDLALSKADSKIAEISRQKDSLFSEFDKLRLVVEERLSEAAKHKAKVDTLSSAISRIPEFEKTYAGIEGKISEAEEKLVEFKRTESALSVKFSEASGLLSSLEGRLASSDDKVSKMKNAALQVESEVSLARQSLEGATTSLFSLKSSIDSFSERFSSLKKAQEGIDSEFSRLALDLSEKRAAYQKMASELSRSFDEDSKRKVDLVQEYERKLSAITDAIERAVRKGSELQGDSEALVSELTSQAEKMRLASRESEKARSDLVSFGAEVTQKTAEISRKVDALSAREPEIKLKISTFANLDEAVSERVAAAKKRDSEIQELERKVHSVSERTEATLKKVSENLSSSDSAKSALAEETESARDAVKEAKEKREELEALSGKVSEVLEKEDEISRIDEKISGKLAEIEDKLAKISAVETILERKVSEVDALKKIFDEKLNFSPSGMRGAPVQSVQRDSPRDPPRDSQRDPQRSPTHAEALSDRSGELLAQVQDLEGLKKERKELSELLLLLSAQREEGLVSDGHFEEISTQTRARLREIERKITETLELEGHLERHEEEIGKIKSLLKKQKAYYR